MNAQSGESSSPERATVASAGDGVVRGVQREVKTMSDRFFSRRQQELVGNRALESWMVGTSGKLSANDPDQSEAIMQALATAYEFGRRELQAVQDTAAFDLIIGGKPGISAEPNPFEVELPFPPLEPQPTA